MPPILNNTSTTSTAITMKKKRKKERGDYDNNGVGPPPKRPKSPYNLYFSEARHQWLIDNPTTGKADPKGKARFLQLSKDIISQWKAMSDTDREPYEKRSNEEKRKYQIDIQDYTQRCTQMLRQQGTKTKSSGSTGESNKHNQEITKKCPDKATLKKQQEEAMSTENLGEAIPRHNKEVHGNCPTNKPRKKIEQEKSPEVIVVEDDMEKKQPAQAKKLREVQDITINQKTPPSHKSVAIDSKVAKAHIITAALSTTTAPHTTKGKASETPLPAPQSQAPSEHLLHQPVLPCNQQLGVSSQSPTNYQPLSTNTLALLQQLQMQQALISATALSQLGVLPPLAASSLLQEQQQMLYRGLLEGSLSLPGAAAGLWPSALMTGGAGGTLLNRAPQIVVIPQPQQPTPVLSGNDNLNGLQPDDAPSSSPPMQLNHPVEVTSLQSMGGGRSSLHEQMLPPITLSQSDEPQPIAPTSASSAQLS